MCWPCKKLNSKSNDHYSFIDEFQNSNEDLEPKPIQIFTPMTKRQNSKYSARFVRSARKHLRIRSETPTTSWTNAERPSSSNVQNSKHDGFNRKRMASNHIGFKMPPHIDKSRSTGNVSVMVGKQLLLTCTIPNTGNESVSLKDFLELIQPFA